MIKILARSQANNKNKVSIIYSRRPDTPKKMELLFPKSIDFFEIKMDGFFSRINSIFSIARIVKNKKADVVFLHSSFAGFVGRVSLFFNKNIKVFYIPHAISFLRKDIGCVKMFSFVLLERLAGLRKSVIVACSKSEKEEILFRLPNSDCRIIENAIQKPTFTRNKTEIFCGEKIFVISVARLSRQKRPDMFADLVALFKEKQPQLPVEFVWVGGGDEKYKQKLLDAGVAVTGWLSTEDVFDWLSRASIYISTSQWEGMPVALIEAQLAGVFSMATRCSGNVDVIENGVTGLLYDTSDEASDMIAEIVINNILYKEMASNAAFKAEGRFDVNRYLEEMDCLINGVIESK